MAARDLPRAEAAFGDSVGHVRFDFEEPATGEIALPLGRSRMSWIDGRDIGAAAAIALTRAEHRNQAYTLTEQAYTVAGCGGTASRRVWST